MAEWDHRWLLGGGIGSGKSEVRRILEANGIATIDADSVGHEVISPDGPAFQEVASRWPSTVSDGKINRAALGHIVFDDTDKLRHLESITHPHIFGMISRRVERIESTVVVEVPVTSPSLDGMWKVMVVDADDGQRLQRAIERGMSEEGALRRMEAQPTRTQWLARADLVIPNHRGLADLRRTVGRVVDII